MNEQHPIETMLINGATLICARIAAVKDLTLEKTEEGFKDATHYIISQETSRQGKLHQHLIISTDGCTEASITERIKKIYPDAKGNKCLYVKKANNKSQAIKYTVKEGEFKIKGFSAEYIKDMKTLSKSKSDMKHRFTKLEEKILLKQITFRQFMKDYVLLKVAHSQPLYDSHIIAYFKRVAIECGALMIDDYIDKMEYAVFSRGG